MTADARPASSPATSPTDRKASTSAPRRASSPPKSQGQDRHLERPDGRVRETALRRRHAERSPRRWPTPPSARGHHHHRRRRHRGRHRRSAWPTRSRTSAPAAARAWSSWKASRSRRWKCSTRRDSRNAKRKRRSLNRIGLLPLSDPRTDHGAAARADVVAANSFDYPEGDLAGAGAAGWNGKWTGGGSGEGRGPEPCRRRQEARRRGAEGRRRRRRPEGVVPAARCRCPARRPGGERQGRQGRLVAVGVVAHCQTAGRQARRLGRPVAVRRRARGGREAAARPAQSASAPGASMPNRATAAWPASRRPTRRRCW